MVRSMTLNLKALKFNAADYALELRKNWRMIVCCALFCVGVFSGTLAFKSLDSSVIEAINSFIIDLTVSSFGKCMRYIVIEALIFVLLAFISAFSGFGLPIIILCPILKGFIYGVINTVLYEAYRINGVIFAAIIVIPAVVLNTVLLIIGCNESTILSGEIAKSIFGAKQGRGEIKDLLLRYLIIAAVTVITACVQALCISGFGENLI